MSHFYQDNRSETLRELVKCVKDWMGSVPFPIQDAHYIAVYTCLSKEPIFLRIEVSQGEWLQ